MKHRATLPPPATPLGYLRDGGEVGRCLLALPAGSTPLGPPTTWPQALHDVLRVTLHSDFPHIVYWGEALHTFWNDAARHFFEGQHPHDLGKPLAVVQPDVMDTLHPLLQQVQHTGRAVSCDQRQLLYQRKDYTEEIHEIFSYSPLLDAAGHVQGVICPIYDTTARVLYERRMATLVPSPHPERRAAWLVAGLTPYKRLNADYRTFLELVAAQIGQGLTDTLALEQAAELARCLAVCQAGASFWWTMSSTPEPARRRPSACCSGRTREVCGLVVALTEGHAWRRPLPPLLPQGDGDMHATGHTPLFQAEPHGRWPPSWRHSDAALAMIARCRGSVVTDHLTRWEDCLPTAGSRLPFRAAWRSCSPASPPRGAPCPPCNARPVRKAGGAAGKAL
ncbi:MAG: PAS domain-containing protein [Pseudomonadota bacterium]